MTDQVDFRKNIVINEVKNNDFDFSDLKIVISRGGLIQPVKSGVYAMNDALRKDLANSPVGEDIINIGGLLAEAIASEFSGVTALIAEPTVVDELEPIARITGYPELSRKSIFHALSQKGVAKKHAESQSKKYEDLNLIVVHMGNGTTVGAHQKGRVIDVNQGFDGDGPFSAVRSGTLPMGEVVRLCYSGKKTKEEMLCLLTQCGGLNAHLGTTNISEIEKRIEQNDTHARIVMEAMAYQVAKAIGEMYAVLKAEVDAILITGELAHSEFVIHKILEHVEKFGPVFVYPGDNDVHALAANANRVLKGEMPILNYPL
jgi:butyrate kinase